MISKDCLQHADQNNDIKTVRSVTYQLTLSSKQDKSDRSVLAKFLAFA